MMNPTPSYGSARPSKQQTPNLLSETPDLVPIPIFILQDQTGILCSRLDLNDIEESGKGRADERASSSLPACAKKRTTEVIESAPTPSTSTAPAADGEGMETNADDPPAGDIIEIAPVPERKVRTPPPFFINPKGDWRQLVAIAKMHAPSFQSQMAGRFLKVTVADVDQYRALNSFHTEAGVEFKSFNLKEDRPVKVVIRGLPSNTEPEDIQAEIEAEGFKDLSLTLIEVSLKESKTSMQRTHMAALNSCRYSEHHECKGTVVRLSTKTPTTTGTFERHVCLCYFTTTDVHRVPHTLQAILKVK
ncbi:zinc finger protein [Trichonephila clavata]|uniref:Zinc finger protein n=1 Tax=Trichonephila clavata TaxID=2740835 RepID=A0A8X6L7M1_TRICU|nr:zinc finger protein [Trichonephila clavata]